MDGKFLVGFLYMKILGSLLQKFTLLDLFKFAKQCEYWIGTINT